MMKGIYVIMSMVLLLGVISCAPIKPLVFETYENVKLKTEGSKAKCNIDLRIKNPNKVGCTLKSFSSKVIIDDVHIGDVSLRNSTRIGAGKVFTIPISFETDITSITPLIKTGMDMLLHQDKKVPVVLDAEITVKKALIKKTIKYKFQQDYSFKDIRR